MQRVRVRVSDRETDNGENWETGTDASFEKHDDAMQMMTWQSRRITGRHLAHRIRGVTRLQ